MGENRWLTGLCECLAGVVWACRATSREAARAVEVMFRANIVGLVYTSKVAELGWLYCCSGVKLVLLLLDDGPRRHAEHPLYTVDLSCHLGTNLAVAGYITTVGKARLWTTKRPLSPSQNRSCPLRHPLTITTVGSPMGSLKHAPIVDPWRVTRRGMLRNRFPAYPMHAICI